MNLRKTYMIILEKQTEKKNLYKKILDANVALDKIQPTSLLTLQQFKKVEKKLHSKNFKVGIIIDSDNSLESIEKNLTLFSMIQINFKNFKDGRPFTMAKELRKLYLFKYEIRASGHILPDQFIFLLRSGFSTVEIKEEEKEVWIDLYKMDDGLYYQP